MEISMLEEFVQLVETCNFQETAARMNISQSALTKHIHKLEEELDITLFDRSQRSIQVNSYSQRFYPHAKQIIQIYQDAVASLHELNQKENSQFTVAYNPFVGQYGLVDTIADFSLKHPEHHLVTTESYTSIKLLESKKCDFAFVSEAEAEGKAENSSFNKLIYRSDHLAVVVPDGHPLAENKCVTFDQLKGERFVLHSSHTDTEHDETRKFLDLCREHQFIPNIVGESQFTSTVLRYVRSGRGIAVLNRMHIPKDVGQIHIIDFSPIVRSHIYLMYRRKLSSPCAIDFLHFIIDQCSF
ncbi:MAG: LysR family transcriptional regulator [Candidatus Ventricola sp.]